METTDEPPLRWPEATIWWHAYPLGFVGAEKAALPAGAPTVERLSRIRRWLPYVVDFGCTGLQLGPVFESETHGYDTVDHFSVDRRLGTADDLKALIDDCHHHGLRILLDGVFNHVGRSFGPFRDVVAAGPSSAYGGWFRIDWDSGAPEGFRYVDFEGHRHLVALNHKSEDVAAYVASIMAHWLAAGIDGWRLDAAYAVPVSFWRRVTDEVRTSYPDSWFVGEVIHGDYERFVTEGGLDSVTQYELWKAVWSSLNDRNLFELAHALRRHGEMVRAFLPQTFVGNHDVTRIASRLDDPDLVGHAVCALLTLPGIPSLYAGDEWGLTGVKENRAGGDDAVRPEFPSEPPEPARGGPPQRDGPAIARVTRDLLRWRRARPWMATADLSVGPVTNTTLAYSLTAGGRRASVLLNIGSGPHVVEVDGVRHTVEPRSWKLVSAD